MSIPSLSLSVERRERHPYRSLYAEMLFQGFHDALAEAREEAPAPVRESAGNSSSAPSEEKRTRRDSRRKRHVPDAQLPEGDCLQQ